MTYERVYTIDEWYDGARTGAATYGGEPHVYRSLALDAHTWSATDDRSVLMPITSDALSWILEHDVLYRRRKNAHD